MKNRIILCFTLLSLIVTFSMIINAHQPRLVFNEQNSIENPFIVENPEVSQAFYGELKGEPQYYLINNLESFNLYINILSPAIENADKDYSAEVYVNNNKIKEINASSVEWTKFYEEFGGDDYWKGPELDSIVGGDSYLIKVSSLDNIGKYVLVIGKKESFPPKEALNAFTSMPKLKSEFFEKNILLSYWNRIGLFTLGFVLIIIGIICGIIYGIKIVIKSRKKKLKA